MRFFIVFVCGFFTSAMVFFPFCSVDFVPVDFLFSVATLNGHSRDSAVPRLLTPHPHLERPKAGSGALQEKVQHVEAAGQIVVLYHVAENKFERFRGFMELKSRFDFDFRRCGNFFVERFEFLVCSKFKWPYMCLCCGLFVPTQFHFECCGVRDDS